MSTATTRTTPLPDASALCGPKAAYWACTSVTALAFAGMGIANLAHADPIIEGLAHLGYPSYFATILGAWKVLAAIAIVAPGLPRAKEWAYAGMFFTLTGAALSHAFCHDAVTSVAAPSLLLAVVMTSRACLLRLCTTQPVQSHPSGEPSHVGH